MVMAGKGDKIMQIREVINLIKSKHKGEWNGIKIQEETTRDKILYGDPDKECTGIVTTIYASVDVIRKAHEAGANLIIAHEACFWNHGDHTDWLEDNETFKLKKALLDETGIVVWRDHDYIHSGVKVDGEWVDGIFYGLMQELEWEPYVIGNKANPMMFEIPKAPTREVAKYIMDKLNLKGMKCMGNLDGETSRIFIPMHIIGGDDNRMLSIIEENHIDTILTMEITDFTVAIYMRDGAQLGLAKAVLAAGHFNVEEPGMKWFASYLPNMIGNDIPVQFIQAGDSYTMLVNE